MPAYKGQTMAHFGNLQGLALAISRTPFHFYPFYALIPSQTLSLWGRSIAEYVD